MDENSIHKRKLTAARVKKSRALSKASRLRLEQVDNSERRNVESDDGNSSPVASSTYRDRSPLLRDRNQLVREDDSDETNLSSSSSFESGYDQVACLREEEAPIRNLSPTTEENDSGGSSPASREENLLSESEEEISDSEESSDDSDNEFNNYEAVDENLDLRDSQRIRSWAIENKITQSALEELLLILRERVFPDLPKCAKTFLQTSSAKYTIEPMMGKSGTSGEFVYYGLKKGLEKCIDPNVHVSNTIELKFSVDGLPVNQSGGDDELWPLLCQVHFIPDIYKPFPVAIFCGKEKPLNTDVYFDSFVAELNELLENGITISEKLYSVTVKCLVGDTPGRAFCKNTAGHVALKACERCTLSGSTANVPSTVYPSVNSELRTDESFRTQSDQAHHNGRTRLLDIRPPINMITSFVLDFMHLCYLGIMKKLIEWWLSGDLNVRLPVRLRNILSDRMNLLRTQTPCEFQRKPRSSKKYPKWKATEFRFFLLYCFNKCTATQVVQAFSSLSCSL